VFRAYRHEVAGLVDLPVQQYVSPPPTHAQSGG
jgi:hypothetical protein